MGTIIEMELSNSTTRTFIDEDVVSAHILEANSPLNFELPIGTLEAVLYSKDDIFNFLNPNGIWQYMKQGNIITISYEFKDGITKQLGQYYLEEWKVEEQNQVRITAIDVIGLLEKHIFSENWTMENFKPTQPIGDLFESAGYSGTIEYSNGKPKLFIKPTILVQNYGDVIRVPPLKTSREFLMELMAVGAMNVLVKRNGEPYIFDNTDTLYQDEMQRPTTTNIIDKSKIIYTSNKNEISKPIKKIQYENCFQKVAEMSAIIYEETKSTGTYRVDFTESYTSYAITNGTIISSGRTYVEFSVSGTNVSVTITATTYTLSNIVKEIDYNINNDKANDIYYNNSIYKISGYDYFTGAFNYWTPYYNRSFTAEMQILMDSSLNEKAGYWTTIEIQNRFYDGVITEMDIDVAGGMIANIKVLCDMNSVRLHSEQLLTEDGDNIITEDNNNIYTEGV